MVNFDLIGTLKRYAEDEQLHFLSGSQWMQNYEASQCVYDNGQLVLAADFEASPNYSKAGAINSIKYDGVLAVGRKFEETTISSLDETFIQKYDNRLLELMQAMNEIIKDLSCANELTIISARMSLELNKFDTNIDFVSAQITFEQ